MNKLISDDELTHYGVLGMKWGVRKASSRVSKSSKKKNKAKSSNSGNRRMSNKELQSRVKRLRLESDYRKLVAELTPHTPTKIEQLIKTTKTIGELSGSALTVYKNFNELSKVINANKTRR